MKGNKLVIAVILALIVCLVLIPTCAFADGEQLVQQSAAGEGGSDNGAGDTSPGDMMRARICPILATMERLTPLPATIPRMSGMAMVPRLKKQ